MNHSRAEAAQVVYDTFTDELRAGYAARIQAREAWRLGPELSLPFKAMNAFGSEVGRDRAAGAAARRKGGAAAQGVEAHEGPAVVEVWHCHRTQAHPWLACWWHA